MLNILGGTYFETCRDPISNEVFGSGLRAATALSNKGFTIQFHSCVDKKTLETASSICNTFGIATVFEDIPHTATFHYDFPLAKPTISHYYDSGDLVNMPDITEDKILYYGLLEAHCKINGNHVVYDPQNWRSFKSTGSTAKHLAIILNQFEAMYFAGLDTKNLHDIGKHLIKQENAEVIVIKNGPKGALVFQNEKVDEIPAFETNSVWPIGSGDIFSAVFAWKWMIQNLAPNEAAYQASIFTAYYCETRDFPLPLVSPVYKPVKGEYRNVYLAGPFFSISERWLIHQLKSIIQNIGHVVFSPFHEAGVGLSSEIVNNDIKGIINADVIFAVVSGKDPGTIFEIGYAKALGKPIIVLSENVSEEDLLMLCGTGCIITNDLSTAVYKISWV